MCVYVLELRLLRLLVQVTGYPIVTLWVSAADDLGNLDVFVYLQAVKPR